MSDEESEEIALLIGVFVLMLLQGVGRFEDNDDGETRVVLLVRLS